MVFQFVMNCCKDQAYHTLVRTKSGTSPQTSVRCCISYRPLELDTA